jgi:SAM-dependent methyltransferase/uncharacterized protein YbaR (Trm112 family)
VTEPTDGALPSLYERPTTTIASGMSRAHRQLALIQPCVEQADTASRRLRILDIGCGDGAATALLAHQAAGHTVIGTDWSQMALARARSRGLTLLRASIDGALPFMDGVFDVIVLSEIIEHLVDPDDALDEAIRVLRPGGSLFLSTPNLAAWFNRVLLLAGVQPVFTEVSLRRIYGRPGTEVVGHLRVFTLAALRGLLRGHGLDIVAVRGATFHATPRLLRPLDRLFQHVPTLAADLIVHARSPNSANSASSPNEAIPCAPASSEETMTLPRPLYDLLACPIDKGPLLLDPVTNSLYNPRLRRAYSIVDGIPNLLAGHALPVDTDAHARIVALFLQ